MDPVSYAVNFYGDALRFFEKINEASLERAWGLFAENGNLISAILALFLILYFLWGALGLSSISLQDMAVTGFKVALAYALIMSWATFFDNIGQFVLQSPEQVGSAISSAMGGQSAGSDLASQVASMARKVYDFAMKLFNSYESGWLPNVTGAVVVFIVLVFGLLPMLLILTGVTLFAKMITAVMLAIGPIAILCYFFGITRFVFEAWVKGIAYGMFMLLFTYIMAGLSFGFLIGMMDTVNGDMATKENALAIVLAMVLYLALISYFIFQVPDFARTFAYGSALSVGPGGGGVDTIYNAARGNLAGRNGRAAQAGAAALGMLAGPKGALAAAALAGRGGAAGAGALGRMLTNRRRNSN
ncbi:type IV secretion system protein (plasmid) [Agrobacterium leguminum]|uniref:type IV secretion system protein n=1 Tax=Agrobacterium leguminum TaxID=2792015 RepID=UPI0010C9B71A|nr:type IV secretion system protein [Agrobacterium leguminum]WFS69573.1 type IV secretion system protein [Agrobacterium leguminum]